MERLPRVAALIIAAALVNVAASMPATGAALTAELQRQVRAATFEIVIRKPTTDSLTYEKPLPLELVPYAERTDTYWPVGTAFAIAPNGFVTAAHVMVLGVGSQFGVPGVRDGNGNVYPIDRVIKFDLHRDFVVFTVSGTPAVTAFQTSAAPAIDDTVFAAGNALGEGVVIRDGLLTSLTPEAQDGKWKWLRFSAAASPGNSGGPLLDTRGRVVGVVTAKSPNENLNYALPIEQVLQGSAEQAVFGTRESFGIPRLLQGTIVTEFTGGFPLPQPYPEFARRFRAAYLEYVRSAQAKLVAAEAGQLFPRSSARLLATLYESLEPTLVTQEDDHEWDAHSCEAGSDTPLPGDGRVWHCMDNGEGVLFRLEYPGNAANGQRYDNSQEFMDLLLKGVKMPRMVGPQAVRITSLGPALEESLLHDRYGRIWQLRTWSLGYADAYVVVLALPTPDGYVGLTNIVPSLLRDPVTERMKLLADYLYLTYTGSLSQWRTYLARRDLRPAVFDHIKLQEQPGKGLQFDSPRLHLDTAGVISIGADTSLDLQMTYMMDDDALTWDVGGVVVRQDRDRKTWLAVYRQAPPAADAGKERRERWEHMTHRDGDFSGLAQHDDEHAGFWIRTVAGGPRPAAGTNHPAGPLYEVVYNTDGKLLPRQLQEIQASLTRDLRIME